MNSRKGKIILNIGVAILFGFTAILLSRIILKPSSVVFSDGSVVTFKKATVGTQHECHAGFTLYDDLKRYWPRFLPNLPKGNYLDGKFTTPQDILVAWFSVRNASNNNVRPDFTSLIEDEHGCVFARHGSSSWIVGIMYLDTSDYYAYPRRQKEFKLVLKNGRANNAVTFTIPNPKVVTPVEWKPEPLPAVRQAGDLKVTLKTIRTVRLNANIVRFAPDFELEQNGQSSRDWTNSLSYSDATGNSASSFLCPHEPALKLTAEFSKTADAPFGTNELWILTEMPAPETGQFQVLSESRKLDGVTIRLVALSGPGITTYSNGIPTHAVPPPPSTHGLSSSSLFRTDKSESASWVLAYTIAGLKPEQDLLCFALDDHGKKTTSSPSSSRFRTTKGLCFLNLPMDKAVKSIQLNIVVQTRRKMEFMVKPPLPPQ